MPEMRIIDAHLHYMPREVEALELPEKLNVKMFNICVAAGDWHEKREHFKEIAKKWPERYAWCTSFDVPAPGDEGYAGRVIEQLGKDFADGAIACKIWKNVGMELKDGAGRYVLCDDEVFEPVYRYLEEHGRTLLAHIAEPLACWRPLDERSPHYSYYKENPKWHMCGREDVPSHELLMAARDRVLEKHPKLRVVGAHLGSLEYSLKEIARRLDRYPNFAVDTSARLGDLSMFRREELVAFITKYSGRIIWGTDLVVHSEKNMPWVKECYAMERAFYQSDGPVKVNGREVRGLGLRPALVYKLFVANAKRWYPGL